MQRGTHAHAAVLAVVAALVGACAAATGCDSIVGIQDGIAEGEDAADATSGGDASSSDGPRDGAGMDTSFDIGVPDGCTMQQADAAKGIFVTQSGAASSCGSMTTPCGSIQTALGLATQAGKTTVYVAQGTYAEAITLPAGVTVSGGWDDLGGTWQPICKGSPASTTVIAAPSGSVKTVVASYAGASTLETLTIKSEPQASVLAGQSVYGVFATGAQTQLAITDVIVDVANAGGGAAGSMGGPGSPGGAAGTCTTPDTGANGVAGTPGTAGGAPSYSVSGYSPGGPGGAGGTGGTGHVGTAAPGQGQNGGPTCVTINNTCGNQGGGCSSVGNVMSCGTTGGPGCAGTGSNGGTGGAGGGSSVGVFAWDAHVTIDAGGIAPGNGGGGGDGGAGGMGGAGTAGAAGGKGPDVPTACHVKCLGQPPQCFCDSTAFTSGAPGTGSTGGNGGQGGQGGGGSGGDSYCYYQGPNAQVSAPSLQCTVGQAGLGGDQGMTNQGANGKAAAHN
jgi:hypothetical protein